MKIRSFLLFSSLCLQSVFAQSLREKYADRLTAPLLYHCSYTAQAPLIDGDLSDDVWHQATCISSLHDIRSSVFPEPTLPTEIRLLWDYDNLYVSARLTEPYITATIAQRDDIVWHENDFEVFLDPDGDGLNYYEIEINALGTLLDLQMSYPYRSGGHFFSAWNCPGLQSAVKVSGTISDSIDTDTCWTLEMAIPHKALSVDFSDALKQSRIWRMNFSRVEWLKNGGPEENWVWSPTGVVDIHMPERWGYVFFAGDPLQQRRSNEPLISYLPDDYRFLWMLFYAQQDAWASQQRYFGSLEEFGLTEDDWQMIRPALLPAISNVVGTVEPELGVAATPHGFELWLKRGERTLILDNLGYFRIEK